MVRKFALVLLVGLLLYACNSNTSESTEATETVSTPTLTYKVVGSYPHDVQSFTEGLYIDNNQIFESTGSPEELTYTQSHYGTLDTLTGKIKVKAALDKSLYFGEGISQIDGKIFQLTYKAQKCFVYDAKTHKKIGEFPYANAEGWGLTNDGKNLIMSDGTHILTFLNPKDFTKVKELNVRENAYALEKINELEYVNGFIYANIWTTNQIIKIDANTGNVVAKADMGALFTEAQKLNPSLMELNGIAYDVNKNEFLITGKLWPKIYRVKFF